MKDYKQLSPFHLPCTNYDHSLISLPLHASFQSPAILIKFNCVHTLSHSMPSTWYHLITPPVKIFGCWKGTGCPLNFRTGSRNCLALCRTAWHNLSLMTLFESPFFCRSSGCRLSGELSSCRRKVKEHVISGIHIKACYTSSQFTPALMCSEVIQSLTQRLPQS